MPLLIVTSPRFADHVTPPGHPERVARAETMEVVATRWVRNGGRIASPRAATHEELARVHSAAYITSIAATAGRAAALDPDTYTSPDSYEVARLAAGAVLVALDHAMAGAPALALVRPPGHHAERDRAMGFCLFNNVAVAAAAALAGGVSRIAIVDFDVHHGNGTQEMFYADPRVLYVSTHQYPFYPGTGAAEEVGHADGAGFTINVPLSAGATDADYDFAFERLIDVALDRFEPELLLVSAGYDGHALDPLAGMRLSVDGYRSIVRRLQGIAARHSRGRLVLVTEGGYDLHALRECLDATVDVLAGDDSTARLEGSTERAEAAVAAARAALLPFWPTL